MKRKRGINQKVEAELKRLGVYEQFVYNLNSLECAVMPYDDEEFINVVSKSFAWEDSKEGSSFWCDVLNHKKLQ